MGSRLTAAFAGRLGDTRRLVLGRNRWPRCRKVGDIDTIGGMRGCRVGEVEPCLEDDVPAYVTRLQAERLSDTGEAREYPR